MTLSEIARTLELLELTSPSPEDANADIAAGYASDLLSDVLAHAPAGGLLVTLQVHLNVIAVAGHAGLRAVVFASNRKPDDDVIRKAADERLSLYASPLDTFDLVGRLYALGVRGRHA